MRLSRIWAQKEATIVMVTVYPQPSEVQLLVMGDFIWHYIRCVSKGIPVSQLLVAGPARYVSAGPKRGIAKGGAETGSAS